MYHSLAFRGHRESWMNKIKGNFKDLLCFIAEDYPPLATYISDHKKFKKPKFDFISWRRQNELINCIADHVKSVILKQIKSSKFFSVMIDTTFDNSKKEQLSSVLWYINNESGEVNERLISMKECTNTSAENLFLIFQQICDKNGLQWQQYLVGQSYDGESNMRGIYNGLQALIKNVNSSAVYIWCYAHRLNLVVTKTVSCCLNAVDMFGILESIYDFISSSKNRVELFEMFQKKIYGNHQRIKRFKRVETTRWWSHDLALNTVLDTYDALCATLENLQGVEYSNDCKGVHLARSLREHIISDRFLLTAFVYKHIFRVITPLSNLLQTKDIDLIGVVAEVQKKTEELESARNDIMFIKLTEEVEHFKTCSTIENCNFKSLPINRQKRVPRMPGENASDEVIEDPIIHFKINTYFPAYDVTITQIKCRFNEVTSGIYKYISLFSRKRIREIANNNQCLPEDAFFVFANVYKQFINLEELKREYIYFCTSYNNFEKIKYLPNKLHGKLDEFENDDVLSGEDSACSDIMNIEFPFTELPLNGCSMTTVYQVLKVSGLESTFPMLTMAIKIAITLPVASTTPERTFSKLTIIKNKLRSTMVEDRLDSLMMLSCEYDINVNKDDVIVNFAKTSPNLEKALIY